MIYLFMLSNYYLFILLNWICLTALPHEQGSGQCTIKIHTWIRIQNKTVKQHLI